MGHRYLSLLFVALILCCLAASRLFAQVAVDKPVEKDKWIRVQSDDSEFSIEVPARYKFFSNIGGFSVSEIGGSSNYDLKNMYMLNAYIDGTMVSFESYEAKKGALGAIFNGDIYSRENIAKSSIQKLGYTIKQTVVNNGEFYLVRQYFNSKSHIYILTAASRNGETPEIRHFLESLRFAANTVPVQDPIAYNFSKLKVSEVGVEMKLEKNGAPKPQPPPTSAPEKDDDKTNKKLALLIKQKAAYVDAARYKNVSGTIKVKVTFSDDGYIPNIIVLETLPEGLLRQVLFAAIRIKFLPVEKDNKPESVQKIIEYSFSIY